MVHSAEACSESKSIVKPSPGAPIFGDSLARHERQDFAAQSRQGAIQEQYNSSIFANMPGPSNTLLIEGTFDELADELAHYIDDVQRKQTPDTANTQAEITPLLEQGQKDEVLKKLVTGSSVLNTAPEKGIEQLYQWRLM